GTPAARSSGRPGANTSPPPVGQRASPLFSQHVLQRGVVEHGFGQHSLQPPILVLERLQPPSFRDVQPSEFSLPLVKGRRANAVLAADLRRRNSGLLLPQHGNDLLFGKP